LFSFYIQKKTTDKNVVNSL